MWTSLMRLGRGCFVLSANWHVAGVAATCCWQVQLNRLPPVAIRHATWHVAGCGCACMWHIWPAAMWPVFCGGGSCSCATLTNMRPKKRKTCSYDFYNNISVRLFVSVSTGGCGAAVARLINSGSGWLIAPPQQQPQQWRQQLTSEHRSRSLRPASRLSHEPWPLNLWISVRELDQGAGITLPNAELFDNAYSKNIKNTAAETPNAPARPEINIVLCALLKFEFQMSHATGKIYFGGNYFLYIFCGLAFWVMACTYLKTVWLLQLNFQMQLVAGINYTHSTRTSNWPQKELLLKWLPAMWTWTWTPCTRDWGRRRRSSSLLDSAVVLFHLLQSTRRACNVEIAAWQQLRLLQQQRQQRHKISSAC